MKEIDKEGFGIRLDFLMREREMTNIELAKKIGVDPVTICNWKYKGEIKSIIYISALAKEFNVKAEWLIYGRITNEKISSDN